MNNDEIVQDFRRRYEGTFVHVVSEQKGIRVLAKMAAVKADPENLAKLDLRTAEFGTISTNLGSEEYQIRFDYPQVGVFQFRKEAIIYQRKPERQYTRGLSVANASFVLTHSVLSGRGGVSLDLHSVKAAFDHITLSWAEAMKGMDSKKYRSVALRNNFSVSLPFSKDKKHFVVWQGLEPVAVVTQSGLIVRMLEPVYKSLLEEILRG